MYFIYKGRLKSLCYRRNKNEIKWRLFYTLREDVSDEDSVSGKLLVKSGMIKKVSNGVYAKTPLGTKAFQNVEEIVRRNMNNAGADELKMPMLLPMDFLKSQEEKCIWTKYV